jgi:hypothetical protein
MVSVGFAAGATPPEGQVQERACGWYRWVRSEDVVEFEEYGWRLCARVSRFHFDSYLMFKPEEQ